MSWREGIAAQVWVPSRGGGGMWRCRSPGQSEVMSSRSPGRCRRGGCAASTTLMCRSTCGGKYLAEELPAVYSERAATVVVFVSAEYAERDWARLERRA